MKKGNFPKGSTGLILCMLIASVSCVCAKGCIPTEKYERVVRLSEPLPTGGFFEAQTHNGYITVIGADVTECNLIATITARADTEENAQRLAEAVEIKLVPSGNSSGRSRLTQPDKLTAKIEKPILAPDECVCVSLDITVPKQTALQLAANVGEIKIANITRLIKAEANIGAISCKEITEDIDIQTNIGEIKVFYSETAPSTCNANIKTNIGEINFDGPPDLSAQVNVSANIGSIETDLPLTIKGTINKSLSGTIGKGGGKVILKTNIGSIKIK